MGTGVGPATSFLKDSGFELEKDGGIAVDEYLRVKGHQHIYAIGDIAHYPQYPDKFQRRVEHWNVAGNHGREVAHNITKPNDQVAYTKIPIFWSSVGKGLRYLGTGAGFDDTYTDGNVDELKVGVVWGNDESVLMGPVCNVSGQGRQGHCCGVYAEGSDRRQGFGAYEVGHYAFSG